MPYKDLDKQKKAQHKSYLKHKSEVRERTRQLRKERIQWFLEIRESLNCQRCGENHPGVLDFHHNGEQKKDNNVSRLVRSLYPKKRILAEIKKCDVLCSNCHRKLHWNEVKN